MNSDSKRLIAAVAALQILLYHCWIPVFSYGTALGSAERFLVAATYPAVDMCFFISAYSLVARPVDDYLSFIKNRVVKLLPLFIIALLSGRFLWFIPSIMVMYLLLPPLYKVCRRKPGLSLLLLLTGWAGLVYLVLGVISPDSDLGIFLFRIPAMILGAYAVRFMSEKNERRSLIVGVLLLVSGILLIYKYGYINRLNVPFKGMFYLTGLPVMLGSVLLFDILAAEGIPRLVERFGSLTLELYFSQMVFGTLLVKLLSRVTGSRILIDVLSIAVIIFISSVVKILNDGLMVLLRVNKSAEKGSAAERR